MTESVTKVQHFSSNLMSLITCDAVLNQAMVYLYRVISLLQQYMNRVEVRSGHHDLITHGIAKGCPLSPLMGALMLKSLDKMIPPGCAYARYMDDWVIFTKTRHQLRRVVKNMHNIVRGLKLKLAVDKTFIGRIDKGFDFLGYRFNATGILRLAQKTIDNYQEKLSRLYEQNAPDQRVRDYQRAWLRWAIGGIRLIKEPLIKVISAQAGIHKSLIFLDAGSSPA